MASSKLRNEGAVTGSKQAGVSPSRGHPIKTSPLISQLRTTSNTNGSSDDQAAGPPGTEFHTLPAGGAG